MKAVGRIILAVIYTTKRTVLFVLGFTLCTVPFRREFTRPEMLAVPTVFACEVRHFTSFVRCFPVDRVRGQHKTDFMKNFR